MESTANNERTSNRVDPSSKNALVLGLADESLPAVVIDESFGGIGIIIPTRLERGTGIDIAVTVKYRGVQCIALVRHVTVLSAGTRIGLEWKAQALSRCLRKLLKAKTQVNQELSRILPGGLSMMWKLYEAQKWEFLIDSGDRLRREVASAGISGLSQPINRFQSVVQSAIDSPQEGSSQTVREALNALIENCVRIVT